MRTYERVAFESAMVRHERAVAALAELLRQRQHPTVPPKRRREDWP